LPALTDPRAIKIDGKPVFIVYKAKSLPDCRRTTDLWRELAVKNGLAGLYLLSIETAGTFGWDPREGGFDAAVEFQPRWGRVIEFKYKSILKHMANIVRHRSKDLRILDYMDAG
jgi:hypothetical protein